MNKGVAFVCDGLGSSGRITGCIIIPPKCMEQQEDVIGVAV